MRKRIEESPLFKIYLHGVELYVEIERNKADNVSYMINYYKNKYLITLKQFLKKILPNLNYCQYIDDNLYCLYFDKDETIKESELSELKRIFGDYSLNTNGESLIIYIAIEKFIESI